MLANRTLKNYQRLAPEFKRQKVEAFRLYDWDIPEVRAVVDWYQGHLVVGEYVRTQTQGLPYLETLAAALSQAFNLPPAHIHCKQRRTRPADTERYQRLAERNERLAVQEGAFQFYVNLDDYIDTGLFADHRLTRRMVEEMSADKRVLNLFAYTGSFSCYAARGKGKVTTVDVSGKYIDWAKDNFQLNDLPLNGHEFLAQDTWQFMKMAQGQRRQWDIIVLDPPSFSTRGPVMDFDILIDHPQLLQQTASLLASGGTLIFSTNHQRFVPDFSQVPLDYQDMTEATTPVDYQRRPPHQCFFMTKP